MRAYDTQHEWVMMTRRGSAVTRCHTVRTVMNQSVGEHTFNMLMIILAVVPDDYPINNVMRVAAFHDLPEQYIGDIPAPAKWENRELNVQLGEVEKRFLREWNLSVGFIHESDLWLIRFADRLELMMYCREEMQLGNTNVIQMWTKCNVGMYKCFEEASSEWIFVDACMDLFKEETVRGQSYVNRI